MQSLYFHFSLGPQQQTIDEFGHFDHYQRVDRGWLTTQTVIQLKLFNNPIQMWKSKLQGVKVSLIFWIIYV